VGWQGSLTLVGRDDTGEGGDGDQLEREHGDSGNVNWRGDVVSAG